MSDDSEDYLILDDEGEGEKPAAKIRGIISLPKIGVSSLPSLRRTPKETIENLVQSEENGFEVSLDGTHQFDWGIRGMDCPDCAMKATRAVNRLPGVDSCRISVSDGTVEISQDISSGSISRSSSVLSSLGHEPDIGWLRAIGISPSTLCSKLGVDENALRNWILNVPGVLDARVEKGRIEIQRVRIIDPQLRVASEQKLSEILGQGYRLEPTRES
ncbi:MAG: cation transporter, partial [Candidatus Thalassarchaeaceae archaeon]|nr:cation transporter [Candidatus Thalassarchaeaceae archaeon]